MSWGGVLRGVLRCVYWGMGCGYAKGCMRGSIEGDVEWITGGVLEVCIEGGGGVDCRRCTEGCVG